MDRIRHVAIVVSDMDKAAEFYANALGLQETAREYTPTGNGLYISDGDTNMALLNYKSDAMAGIKNSNRYIGTHHFGIQVADVDASQRLVEKNGGSFFFDLGHQKEGNFERKLKDPNGVIIDVSKSGWQGTPSRLGDKDRGKPVNSSNKIRHVAITAPDPKATGKFYQACFGFDYVGETVSPLGDGVYLTDGYITLAILRYTTDEACGRPGGKNFIGTHHFGIKVGDLEGASESVKKHGGTFFLDLPVEKESLYFERKFRDPDGIIFDISQNGWGTKPAKQH